MNDELKAIGRRKRRRRSVETWLYDALGEEYCGSTTMPLDHRTLTWTSKDGCERVFVFLNDGFEVGFGYPHEWQVILRREDFHKVARWYVRQWAFGEWFGLRRVLWYRLLHRRVDRTRREVAHQRDAEGTTMF